MSILKGGRIRKVSYGGSKQAQIAYCIGRGEVVSIEEDSDYLETYGKRRFLVLKLDNDGKEAVIWKELVDLPIEVEYLLKTPPKSHESN